jgi:hypothetical protein
MEDNDLKRKADEPLEESSKRLRIETTSEIAGQWAKQWICLVEDDI